MERKPEGIRRAQKEDDVEALSVMGHNGARQAQINRTIAEKRRLEMLKAGMWQNHIQANEHIVGPNGEPGEFPDGIIPPEFR